MFEKKYLKMQTRLKPLLCLLFACLSFLLLSLGIPKTNTNYDIAKGKVVFSDNCSGCHGMRAEGSFGPNLTDNYFLHGHHYLNVHHIVKHGNKKGGMTAFAHHLTHHQLKDVCHFVMTLKGTNVAGGKAPQGKLHK